ncbi:MAG: CinA family protein [bacterium]|nr:CinA family protein [bacterium]
MDNLNKISKYLIDNKLKLSTTESCTGGLLSSKFTDISGSSAYIGLNLVTYSNYAKMKLLNVDKKVLDTVGAVSEECAFQMAKGLHELTDSDICISTTGIAGPTGGSIDKPVGLMYSAIYTKNKFQIYKVIKNPNIERIQMKEEFTKEVLKNLVEFLGIK